METIQYKFLEVIPDVVEEGMLYISMERSVAIHLCICGCKNEVVTPFSPTDWELRFYGNSISLSPSIGNWEFRCQSHYWIKKNKIHHSPKWEKWEIESGRKKDKEAKLKHYNVPKEKPHLEEALPFTKKSGFWNLLIGFFKSK